MAGTAAAGAVVGGGGVVRRHQRRAAARAGCGVRTLRPLMLPLDVAFVGAASAASFAPSPAKAGEGWGGVPLGVNSNRGHPLPAFPCLRRGRGQGNGLTASRDPAPAAALRRLRRTRRATCNTHRRTSPPKEDWTIQQ